ncbi:MAG: molybdenum ABC transporter ATP-binding protein [Alphaproteobacteria bacterium]
MSLSVSAKTTIGSFSLDVNFESEGHVTALFGRSGAGKTTLVNMIAGLTRPDSGLVRVDDVVLVDTEAGIFVPAHKRRIGYVFQEGRLFPHMTVQNNMMYGGRSAPVGARWAELEPIVALLGIDHLLDRRPASLSGGEKQRVAIGRALMTSPRLLLMDEPLAAIDQTRRSEILPYLDRLRSEMRIPLIYVSHAVEEIARIADVVVVLDEGRAIAVGPTADILAALDLASLDGGEAGVILTTTVAATDRQRGLATVTHAAGRMTVSTENATVGDSLRLRVHARDVALAIGEPGQISIRNRLPATIAEIRPGRNGADIRLDLAGSPLLARLTEDAVDELGLRVGTSVTALIKAVAVEGY